jgi:hypothetical protein
MKNFKLAGILLLASFVFISCDKDDESVTPEVSQEKKLNIESDLFDAETSKEVGYNTFAEMLADGYEDLDLTLENVVTEHLKKDEIITGSTSKSTTIGRRLTFKDLRDIGFNEFRLRGIVEKQFGRNPDGLSLNGETMFKAKKPTITDQYSKFASIQVGKAKTKVTQYPKTYLKLVHTQVFRNTGNQSASYTATRSVATQTTSSWEITVSANLTVTGTVGIPLVSEGSISLSLGVEGSHGQSKSRVITNTYSTTFKLPPHSYRSVTFYEGEERSSVIFTIPVYITGYMGANFGKKTNGHYFWFPTIASIVGGERQQKGKVSTVKIDKVRTVVGKTYKI